MSILVPLEDPLAPGIRRVGTGFWTAETSREECRDGRHECIFAPGRMDSDENGSVGGAVEVDADTGDVEVVRVYDPGPRHGWISEMSRCGHRENSEG